MIARKDVKRRVAVAAAAFAAGALLLTGCGAGQITQTSSQVAAVNGNEATIQNNKGINTIALRNVRILAPTDGYTNDVGGKAILAFVAVNMSPDQTIKLININSDVAGSVDIGQVKDITPLTTLKSDVTGSETGTGQTLVTVVLNDLKQKLVEGPNYGVTFNFDGFPQKVVQAPIDSEGHDRYTPPASPAAPAEGH